MRFRFVMAAFVLAICLLGGGYLLFRGANDGEGRNEKAASAEEGKFVPVVLARAEKRSFEASLEVEGALESRNFALVSPVVPGVLEAVLVKEGDQVFAGRTPLFRTDSLKLQKALEMARQSVQAAHFSRQEKEASAQKTDAELRKAERDYERFRALFAEKAVSQGALDEKESIFHQLQAMRRNARSVVEVDRQEERKALAALAMAEKDLRDALVLSPIDGRVSHRMAEPGEMGAPGTPVLRIDDVTSLDAVASLPGQFYGAVRVGVTRVRVGSGGGVLGEYLVTYKSPTVDPTLRTFEIKCALPGDGERFVPGLLVDLHVVLETREALGVPTEAVLERVGRKCVFTLSGDVARIAEVETGIESDGWIEMKKGAIAEGMPIVGRGQFLLDDGVRVLVRQGVE